MSRQRSPLGELDAEAALTISRKCVWGVTYLMCPEISTLTWLMELQQWVTETVGRPDWSLPKFRETKMEMPSTLRSNVPCRVLGGRNEKQRV